MNDLLHKIFPTITVGLSVSLLFIVMFLAFSVFVPLNGAVIAPSTIVPSHGSKIIQHLRGGKIDKIFIQEGQLVHKGDILITLHNEDISAELHSRMMKKFLLQIKKLRLESSLSMSKTITISSDMMFDITDEQRTIINDQKKIFFYYNQASQSKNDILNKRISSAQEEMHGITAQLSALEQELKISKQQLDTQNKFLTKGITTQDNVIKFQQNYIEMQSRIESMRAQKLRLGQDIKAKKLEIINLRNTNIDNIANEIQKTDNALIDIIQSIKIAESKLKSYTILAQQDGSVLDLQYHSAGEVILPGQRIMYITPSDEKLVLQARIKSQDIAQALRIDERNSGFSPTKIRLTGYNTRRTPLVDGTMHNLSSSSIKDSRTGMEHYTAYVEINPTKLPKGIKLYPGMHAQIYIKTEERTLISYLVRPLLFTIEHAFREE